MISRYSRINASRVGSRCSAPTQAAKPGMTPISSLAIHRIANRLGANQALGDIVERVARKRREIEWAWKYYISLYHRNMRFLTIKEMFRSK